MKSVEEIGGFYCQEKEEVERDLFALLRALTNQPVARVIPDGNYRKELSDYLYGHNFLCFEYPNIRLTQLGEQAIERGWVTINLKKMEHKELTPVRQNRIAIIIAGLSLCISILDIFVPIPKAQSLLETKEFVIESVNSPVDTVANAGKSYDYESLNCQKNKN